MIRVHRIPIVGLVLSLSCNQRPGPSSDGSTTVDGEGGTFGASETGNTPTTSGIVGVETTGSSGADVTGDMTSTSTSTSTGTGDTTSDTTSDDVSSSGTEPFCYGVVGDSTYLPTPIDECPCAPGEICVRRLACPTIPNLCDNDDIPEFEDECYVEQHPKYCEPIPDHCQGDPRGLEACLEEDSGPCSYDGGDYVDGVLSCDYFSEQCAEPEDVPPYCMDLYP